MSSKNPFQVNPHKATMRISVNSAMIGALFFVLTFILTVGSNKFDYLVLLQLVLAIPLLYVSVLTYSKIAYLKDNKAWDLFGWIIGYTGNTIVLNAIGLMVASISQNIALLYFITIFILMTIYTLINIYFNNVPTKVRLGKFFFFIFIFLIGGVLPLIKHFLIK